MGPGSLTAGVTDGAKIMESQVVNKTSKMLVTHALNTTVDQPPNCSNQQYSILTPFSRMIDIGMGAAKKLTDGPEVTSHSFTSVISQSFASMLKKKAPKKLLLSENEEKKCAHI